MQPDVLKTEVITNLIQLFTAQPGMAGLNLAPRLPTSKFIGQTARWDLVKANRHLATFDVPGAPSSRETLMVKESKSSTCAYFRKSKMLDAQTLFWVRNPGSQFNTQQGKAAVTQEMQDLNWTIDRTVEYMIWQMMAGTLTVNQDGVKFTVDYGIDATHKPTTGTSWATIATADVIGDIATWKKLISRDLSEEPTDMYVNETVMTYMIQNAKVRELMRNQFGQQMLESGKITKIMGLNIHEYNSGYTPKGGSFTPYIPDDKVVIIAKGNSTPGGKVTNKLFDLLEGSSLDVKANGRPGKFGKSWEEEDPSGIQVLTEWYTLPILFKPDGVVYADVIP